MCGFDFVVGDGKCFGNAMWASIWGKEVLHVRGIHAAFMDCSLHMLYLPFAYIPIRDAGVEAVGATGGAGGAVGGSVDVVDTSSLRFRVSVSAQQVPAEPVEDCGYCLGVTAGTWRARVCELVVGVQAPVWGYWHCCNVELLLVGPHFGPFCLHGLRWLPSHLDRFLHGSLLGSLGVRQTLRCFWSHALVLYYTTFGLIIISLVFFLFLSPSFVLRNAMFALFCFPRHIFFVGFLFYIVVFITAWRIGITEF